MQHSHILVRPHITYKVLAYLKSNNKFYEDVSIWKGLLSKDKFTFSDIVEIQGQNKTVTEKIISDRKKISENRNDTETEYDSVEDPLNMQELHQMRRLLFLRFQI